MDTSPMPKPQDMGQPVGIRPPRRGHGLAERPAQKGIAGLRFDGDKPIRVRTLELSLPALVVYRFGPSGKCF
jgi:hypothetical protein